MNQRQKAASSIAERLKEVDFDRAAGKMKARADARLAAKGPTDAEIIAQKALDKVFAENQRLEREQQAEAIRLEARQKQFEENWPLTSVIFPLYGPKGGSIAIIVAHVTAVIDHVSSDSCVIRVMGGDGWPVALSREDVLQRLGL